MKQIRNSGKGLEDYPGAPAFFDSERDECFTELASFSAAVSALEALSQVQAQCGLEGAKRLALQFIYTFCLELQNSTFDLKAFDTVWAALWSELRTNEWTYAGVAILQNFQSDGNFLDLGDGVTIRSRASRELQDTLCWSKGQLDRFNQEFHERIFGSHALLVEYKAPKAPDNVISIDGFQLDVKASRALLALRLLKAGDVRMGHLFPARPAKFNYGIGGISMSGYAFGHTGRTYELTAFELPAVRALDGQLARFETKATQNLPNIDIALRSFSSMYERYPRRASDQVVDAITAIEALLSKESQVLTFKLAFRTAGLLAAADDDRLSLFDAMKTYYETRSKIVHGDALKEKHQKVLFAAHS